MTNVVKVEELQRREKQGESEEKAEGAKVLLPNQK